jgi:hypothetical protein
MNFQKIRKLEDKITKNRQKLMEVKEPKKKEILRLTVNIDELKVKLERMK